MWGARMTWTAEPVALRACSTERAMRSPAAPKQTAARQVPHTAAARLARSVILSCPPSMTTMEPAPKAVRAFSTESVLVALESLTKWTPAWVPQGSMRCSMGLKSARPRASASSEAPRCSAHAAAARAFSQLWRPRILRAPAARSSCSTPDARTTSMPSRTKAASAEAGSPSTESSQVATPRARRRSRTARHQSSSTLTMARSPSPRLAKTFSLAAA